LAPDLRKIGLPKPVALHQEAQHLDAARIGQHVALALFVLGDKTADERDEVGENVRFVRAAGIEQLVHRAHGGLVVALRTDRAQRHFVCKSSEMTREMTEVRAHGVQRSYSACVRTCLTKSSWRSKCTAATSRNRLPQMSNTQNLPTRSTLRNSDFKSAKCAMRFDSTHFRQTFSA